MGNWGENLDYEAMAIKDHKGRFTVNFKKIYMYVDEISQRTLEVTDKHPKDSLLKLWAGAMTGIFVFFVLSYQILFLITIPFLAFYLIALFRIAGCWKSFKYSAAKFWSMTIFTVIALFAVSRVVQFLIEKFLF